MEPDTVKQTTEGLPMSKDTTVFFVNVSSGMYPGLIKNVLTGIQLNEIFMFINGLSKKDSNLFSKKVNLVDRLFVSEKSCLDVFFHNL